MKTDLSEIFESLQNEPDPLGAITEIIYGCTAAAIEIPFQDPNMRTLISLAMTVDLMAELASMGFDISKFKGINSHVMEDLQDRANQDFSRN